MILREELISFIRERTNHITNDAHTFLWARTTHLEEFSAKGMGGGNFLIGLGLFAALSYLAKIFFVLEGGEVFADEAASSDFYKSLPKDKRRLLCPKRNDSVDETRAVEALLRSTDVRTGLSLEEIVSIYKSLRHKLAHMVAPRDGYTMVALISEEDSYESVKDAILNQTKGEVSFVAQPSGWQCYVDVLAFDLEKIAEWLIKKIETDSYNDDAIMRVTEWLRRELS